MQLTHTSLAGVTAPNHRITVLYKKDPRSSIRRLEADAVHIHQNVARYDPETGALIQSGEDHYPWTTTCLGGQRPRPEGSRTTCWTQVYGLEGQRIHFLSTHLLFVRASHITPSEP